MRASLVVNPHSGGGKRLDRLAQAVDRLRHFGWEVSAAETDGQGRAGELARAAVEEGWDVVVACGGDGTTNEVIQPLVGSRVSLGVIPLGTANVFARQAGIPLDPVAAANVLAEGRARQLDVGVAAGRYFLLWLGMGFDAEVVRMMERNQGAKKRWGIIAFVVAALWQALKYRPYRARVRVNRETTYRDILLLLACNARTYALLDVARRARMDDGKLDVLLFEGRDALDTLGHAARALLGRHYDGRRLEYWQTRELVLRGTRAMPAQVDGEPLDGPVERIGVVPGGLWVILPNGLSSRAR